MHFWQCRCRELPALRNTQKSIISVCRPMSIVYQHHQQKSTSLTYLRCMNTTTSHSAQTPLNILLSSGRRHRECQALPGPRHHRGARQRPPQVPHHRPVVCGEGGPRHVQGGRRHHGQGEGAVPGCVKCHQICSTVFWTYTIRIRHWPIVKEEVLNVALTSKVHFLRNWIFTFPPYLIDSCLSTSESAKHNPLHFFNS